VPNAKASRPASAPKVAFDGERPRQLKEMKNFTRYKHPLFEDVSCIHKAFYVFFLILRVLGDRNKFSYPKGAESVYVK